MTNPSPPLDFLHPAARAWFEASFDGETEAQRLGWPPIEAGESTLLLAPTGSGKTLAAFLSAINRLMFAPTPARELRCRVLYISPIKALGVDVERNLRAPLIGIAEVARGLGYDPRDVVVGVRSGDTPQRDRARMKRHPPDILITTPESLYLMLTSSVRQILVGVETVIIDEIHSVVGSKRGTHLALSLERLEWLRTTDRPLQRIGLSATQRPLDEIARYLGGCTVEGDRVTPRPVTIVDAGRHKPIDLTVEMPAAEVAAAAADPEAERDPQRSAWPAIHPRLIQLIRAHRSTMIFTNSRRLSERLANALNELAGEELAMAHHGSLAKDARAEVEERLKQGLLPAIVATSSLELGIDMGAVDLVIQLEAPPTIASGLQRIGRASHHVGGRSRGVMVPKFKGDLLASAAAAKAMLEGRVESTRYPRNPLDVLAQQVVAAVSADPWAVEPLYDAIRRAAPYADLPRDAFEGVLDMLSGRYPSDDFSGLRARLTYDRVAGQLEPRKGARQVAIINGGTIPDRGLYGVFLAGDEGRRSRRVGELDEEMVFESRPGDVFLLGATSWRIEEITPDKVLVVPAPGEPGRMPFWRGEGPGRPREFGEAIGALSRQLSALPPKAAEMLLRADHRLDGQAAESLVGYIAEQRDAGALPTDRTIIVERFMDEIGDWRVCVLSPFGAPVHAPWAMAVRGAIAARTGVEVDANWTDDGIVFRMPEGDEAPDVSLFLPPSATLEDTVVGHLAATSLFGAIFRENAGRSLLLTRKRPGQRTPLWALRRKSAALLSVASRYRDFPIVLETYRACLQDAFDLPGCVEIMRRIEQKTIEVVDVVSDRPSPFAGAMLFHYVGNFMYEGDAPMAERRAQALTIDPARLRALLGEAALRDLLDADAIETLGHTLQRRQPWLDHPDTLHDLLLALGDLDRAGLVTRRRDTVSEADIDRMIDLLVAAGRVLSVQIAGARRFIAAEDAGRYRDGAHIALPAGLPAAFLQVVDDPLGDLVARHARTHGPFTAADAAARFGVDAGQIVEALRRLAARHKVVEGEFLPHGSGREWCDAEVLRRLKRLSLARLREAVKPVGQDALARFILDWHGIGDDAGGPEALLSVVEQLQGAPLPASLLESDILPARIEGYHPGDLDLLCAAGEVIWQGVRPLGQTDGYVALYLAEDRPLLAPDPTPVAGPVAEKIRSALAEQGALFFEPLTRAVGGFDNDVLDALWAMVWAGEVTNDTLTALRSRQAGTPRTAPTSRRRGRRATARARAFRSRRGGPPGSEGRWSLLPQPQDPPSLTERRTALARQLLDRYGVLTREAVASEELDGGFGAVYPVLKAMEEAGQVRRGYFTDGLGATQFALPGADDRLRATRAAEDDDRPPVMLAATDPANPFGAALPWPDVAEARFERAVGARVLIDRGRLLAFLSRSGKTLYTHLPDDEPARTEAVGALVIGLIAMVIRTRARALMIEQIDGHKAIGSPLAKPLLDAGFRDGYDGLILRAIDARGPST